MGIRTFLFGGKETAPAPSDQVSPLNVNVVTEGGRTVGIPQPSGNLNTLMTRLERFFPEETVLRVALEYSADLPGAPAGALSQETTQKLIEIMDTNNRQQGVASRLEFHKPSRFGRLTTLFRYGEEDDDTHHLIREGIRR